MRRSAVFAVYLGVIIALSACANRTVDEELLPTRVPTLGPETFAVAPDASQTKPEPTATATPIPPTAEPDVAETDTPTPVVDEAAAEDTQPTEAAPPPTIAYGLDDAEPVGAGDTATEKPTPENADPAIVESEAITETGSVTDVVPSLGGQDAITVTEAITDTESITDTGSMIDTEDAKGSATSDAFMSLPTATLTPEPMETPESDSADTAEEIDPTLVGMPDTLLAAMAEADPDNGELLTLSVGCSGCHSLDPNQLMAGPTWNNLAQHAAERVEGESAGLYLYHSIVDPNAYVVEGFQPNIMLQTYKDTLTEENMADIIAYLLTIRSR